MTARRSTGLVTALAFGYAFLYLPVALLILYSFNESRLVTVWAGFSTHWYVELVDNDRILDAAGLSLMVAATSATIAAVLGGLAGLALGRFGRFRGRAPFAGLLAAPLVMPEVLMGLSLLLFFVALGQAIGWPGQRGFTTIVIAHATFGTAFVAVVVQARVRLLDPALEEAAHDLGAPPLRTFLYVTLPMLAPALAAGWLLGFTLSLDDLVIASFTTGPGATTLPMVVFSSIRLGVSPQINALASLFVLAAAILVTAASWFLRRQERAGV
ncbi:MAG: ABC transporter permease subunit [Candidatus Eiseniibacteriota bacterium]